MYLYTFVKRFAVIMKPMMTPGRMVTQGTRSLGHIRPDDRY